MGYVARVLKEPWFWFRLIVLPAIVAVNVVDVMTVLLASPGVFRLWAVRVTIVAGLCIGLAAALRNTRKQKKQRLETESQKSFEKRRLTEFQRRVATDPDFQTLCFRCRHFDSTTGGCRKEIVNLSARRVRLGTKSTYCLYWESSSIA